MDKTLLKKQIGIILFVVFIFVFTDFALSASTFSTIGKVTIAEKI